MKEIKSNESSRRKVGYSSPSVRVVAVKMSHAILTVSNPEYETDPSDMEGRDVF